MRKQGLLITLEGIDGAGKSTHLRLLAGWLRRQGYRPRVTREPGGTRVGEQIRKILLASANSNLLPATELLLMYAARYQHVEEVVRPALGHGELLISDRFNDASLAYQGYGRQLGVGPVRALDALVCSDLKPDLTLILDAPPRLALRRATQRGESQRHKRFESAGLKFYTRVRKGYLEIACNSPERVRIIRADRDVNEVQADVRKIVGSLLERRGFRR